MSDERDKKPNQSGDEPAKEEGKGYKGYLNDLRNKDASKISAWIGKASDIYAEINKYAQAEAGTEGAGKSIVAPDGVVQQGALSKAVEIARLEWVKAKLESEDPVDLSAKYNARMARLNDEYHHKKLLFPEASIVGFMKDKDTQADRLLVSRDDEESSNKVLAVDPTTGNVVEVFEVSTRNCLLALRRAGE
jgi:hypothetical protein